MIPSLPPLPASPYPEVITEGPITEGMMSEGSGTWGEPMVGATGEGCATCAPPPSCPPTKIEPLQLRVIAEGLLLSRSHDVSGSSFQLFNSQAVIDENFYSPPDTGVFLWGWVAQDLQLQQTLLASDEETENIAAVPRLTAGLFDPSGYGVQMRYFHLEQTDNFSQTGPSLGTITAANNFAGILQPTSVLERFEARTADLELAGELETSCWEFAGSLGARFIKLQSDRSSLATGRIRTGAPAYTSGGFSILPTFTNANYDLLTMQQSDFKGLGPSLSLFGLRRFGRSPNVGMFAGFRPSAAFGKADNSAFASTTYDSVYGSGQTTDSQTIADSAQLYIAEFQVGAQVKSNIRFMNGQLFARAAIEYQYWKGFGTQAQAESVIGDHNIMGDQYLDPGTNGDLPRVLTGVGTTQGTATAVAGRNQFELIGCGLSAGLTW